MDMLIIFGAKYLFLISPLLALYVFYKAPREDKNALIVLTLVTLPLAYVFAVIARHIWFDPRPFVVGGFTPLVPHLPDNGFPSDHALLTAALAAIIAYFDKKTTTLMWLITLLVGATRVAAGIHHWRDIAGSIVIALVAAFLARAIIERLWKNTQVNS